MESTLLSEIIIYTDNDEELNEIEEWLSNFQEEFNNEFPNKLIDDIELIKQNIINKYLFCSTKKKTILYNNVGIAINNILSIYYKIFRDEAIKNNIENEISENIIEKNIFLICNILKKNNITFYDYQDKTNILNKLHEDLCNKINIFPIDNIDKIIYWKDILHKNNFEYIKNILNIYIFTYIKNKKSVKNKKIISSINLYLDTFDSIFNETFKNDYYELTIQ